MKYKMLLNVKKTPVEEFNRLLKAKGFETKASLYCIMDKYELFRNTGDGSFLRGKWALVELEGPKEEIVQILTWDMFHPGGNF